MQRREVIASLVKTVLVAAKTAAGNRVYISRVKPFDVEHSSDVPPAICIYMTRLSYTNKTVGVERGYEEDSVISLEVWAEIDGKKNEELQDRVLNAFCQQIVKALFGSNDFLKLWDFRPDVTAVFGMDMSSQLRVGCAVLEFTGIRKKIDIATETELDITYDELQQIWIDHKLPPVDPDADLPLAENPDLKQDISGLEE